MASQTWQIEPTYTYYWYQNIYTTQQFFNSAGFGIFGNTEGFYGAADINGNTVIPFLYENMMPMNYGMIPFKIDGHWGFMDENANIIIPNQYETVTGFSEIGIAVAVKDGNPTLIDRNGNTIPGTEAIDTSVYFTTDADGTDVISAPGEYVIIHENDLAGFAKLDYTPALPTAEDMSSWAVDYVQEGIIADLIPVSLQNRYTANITRGDFATLAVHGICTILDMEIEDLVLAKTGKTLQAHISEYPFQDSSDSSIIAGNALGIVQGRGENTFDPYAEITRQEAAIMLQKMVAVGGISVADAVAVAVDDVDSIAFWASDAVNYVSQEGIMTTMGDNLFSPLTSYTREQSFATVLRVMKTIQGS